MAVFVMVVFIGIRFYGFDYVYARKREMVGKNSKKLHQPKKLFNHGKNTYSNSRLKRMLP
jgi:hypothetical protein